MIAVLDDHVIDQIAAGEVIERPASAVKELVENAFDAGAESVQVELAEGGLERITVSDDGRGMNRHDARTCIERHATSKLRTASDLAAIRSYGFRGEALSSIGSVSELVISTRREDEDVGSRVAVAAGALVAVDDYGGPSGTTVDVRGLFFNTPARRKFMRSPATEQAHAVEAALRVALGARRGGVIVGSGTRRLLDIPEDQAEPERVKAALGPRVRDLVPFSHDGEGVQVAGYVTPLDTLRNDTKGTWFFVNGRFVRERLLQRALVEVFRPQLPAGRYPMAVVYVDVDATSLDVNVHPQKLEVRFSDSSAVYRAVTSAFTDLFVSGAFAQREAFSDAGRAGAQRATERFFDRVEEEASLPYRGGTRTSAPRDQERGDETVSGGYTPAPLQQSLPEPAKHKESRRWVMRERDDSVLLVDVEAVVRHRIEEGFRDALAAGESAPSVELLLPEILEVDDATGAHIERMEAGLSRFGLEVSPVGPGRYALRAVPELLKGADARRVAETVLGLESFDAPAKVIRTLASIGAAPSEKDRARWIAQALAQGPDGRLVFRLSDDELRQMLLRH